MQRNNCIPNGRTLGCRRRVRPLARGGSECSRRGAARAPGNASSRGTGGGAELFVAGFGEAVEDALRTVCKISMAVARENAIAIHDRVGYYKSELMKLHAGGA